MAQQNGTDGATSPLHGGKRETLIAVCKGGSYVKHAYVLTDRRLMVVRLKPSRQHRVSGMDYIIGMKALQKIEANTEHSYALVNQLAQAGGFDRIAEDFVTDQISAQDAEARIIMLEDDRSWVCMSLSFKTDIPNIHGGPFPREFGEQLLAQLELWTGQKLQFWKPRWWQGGASGWCLGASDMEAKRKSIDVSSLWCRECTKCGHIRKTKQRQCPKCGGSNFT